MSKQERRANKRTNNVPVASAAAAGESNNDDRCADQRDGACAGEHDGAHDGVVARGAEEQRVAKRVGNIRVRRVARDRGQRDAQ